MASFNSPLFGKQTGASGGSAASNYPLARVAGGKLRFMVVDYVVDGAEASADTIKLCRLKPGAVVVPALCRVVSDTGFDCSAMNVGIEGNTNQYANALDTLDTASDISFGQAGDTAYAPEAVGEDGEDVIATLTTVVTTTAGGKALFLIAYLDE